MGNTLTPIFSIPVPAAGDQSWEDEYQTLVDLVEDRLSSKVGRKNGFIDGRFQLWPEGNSFTADGYTSAMARTEFGNGSGTVRRQAFTVGQTDVPYEPKYYWEHERSVASTADTQIWASRIPGVRNYAGRTVTFSFYAWSSVNKVIDVGYLQNFGSGGFPDPVVQDSQPVQVNAAIQKFSVTFDIPSISGKSFGVADDYIEFRLKETSPYSTFFLWLADMQVEEGAYDTAIEQRSKAEEIQLFEPYYEKSYDFDTVPGTITDKGLILEIGTRPNAAVSLGPKFRSEKIRVPTVTLYANASGNSGKITNNGDKTAVPSPTSIGTTGVGWIDITSGETPSNVSYHFAADARL